MSANMSSFNQPTPPNDASSVDAVDALRTNLSSRRIRGRSQLSIYLTRQRVIRYGTALAVITALCLIWAVYSIYLAPVRAEQARQAQLTAQLETARQSLAASQYVAAESQFQAVLLEYPDSVEAQEGLTQTQEQMALVQRYDQAVLLMEQGRTEEALASLMEIQLADPGFRDVSQRVESLLLQQGLIVTFSQAEEAFWSERWSEAVRLYDSIRERNIRYEEETIGAHLHTSLFELARSMEATPDLSVAEIDQVIAYYRQALTLQPGDGVARAKVTLLTNYLQARNLLLQNNLGQAEQVLAGIYGADSRLLNGDVRDMLYATRLSYGWQLEQAGDLRSALNQYLAAARMTDVDTSEAQSRASRITMALIPTATPTPTPSPTPTPDRLTEFLDSQPTPPPPATPIEQLQGWIAYYSDRPGSRSGLWAMSPDGSAQVPVSDPNGVYQQLKLQSVWTHDNSRRIWVESDKGTAIAIYMWRYDIPQSWRETRVELLNNTAVNYEVVFSPDDQSIAFTSQKSGGDEIWVFQFADFNSSGYVMPDRLTWNTWQWDKHPTFSPDSQTIAFWSNRSGVKQIWAMNLDGSNQRNLSNSEWNDWDPVYILPVRQVPKVK